MAGITAAAIGAGSALYGASKQAKAAKKAAKATVPVPYGVNGPAGNVSVDKNGKVISLSAADNPFQAMLQSLGLDSFGAAQGAQNQSMYGADPELQAAYQGLFGQGLTDNVTHNYDLLNQLAAHGENQQALNTADRIFARGQLGTSGGAEQFRALREALGQNDLGRQQAALGLGRQEALDRFTGAQSTIQQGMAGQAQNVNIGQAAFGGLNQIMQQLFQQAGLGVSAGGGQAPGAAQFAAQQAGVPYQAANQFLQNSGAYDWLGSKLGGLFGGQAGASSSSGPL